MSYRATALTLLSHMDVVPQRISQLPPSSLYGSPLSSCPSLPSYLLVRQRSVTLGWLVANLPSLALALRHFMHRRVTFAAHLNTSNSALTTSRYLRLMLMSALQMVWSLAITCYALWFTTISIPIRPWTAWDDVHSDFLRVDTFLTLLTPPEVVTSFYILWWTVPISTFLFVAFFAFGRDAVAEYRRCFLWFRIRVLRRTVATKSTKGSFSSMPTIG
jgi:hypothetical protein